MKSHCSARPHATALLVLPLPPGRGGGRTCLGPVDPTRLPPSRATGSARSARQAGMGVEKRQGQSQAKASFDPLPPLPLPGGGSNADVWRKP